MNKLETMKTQMTKKEIISKLYPLIPEKLQKEPITFLEGGNGIRIGNHLYFYHITKNGQILFTERRRRGNDVYDVILTGNKIAQSSSIKTKKGKMKNGKKFLFVCAGVLLIAMYQNNKTEKKEEVVIEETMEKEDIVIPASNLDTVVQELNYPVETKETRGIQNNNAVISVNIEVTPTDYLGYEKRLATEEKYGELTEYYAKRRGLDKELVISLFTRERYGEKDKVRQRDLEEIGYKIFDRNTVNVEEKMKENVGQLTRAICGELIISPVFQDGVLVGEDKIYVLPPCFDNYKIEDLNTLCTDERFTETERNILKKGAELQASGNCQILKRKDAFYNVENNINVATAYLSYLINKKQDLIRGVMSYNAGYGSVPNDLDYESIFNGSVEAYDPYYIPKILQYASFKNGSYSCTIQFKTGEVKTYEFHNTRVLEEEYEKENGYSL